MSRSFVHQLATGRVVFGTGTLGRVAGLVDDLGARRVLLIAEDGTGWADRIAQDLGPLLVGRIGDAVAHVPVEVAEKATTTASELDADLLLCIGGGSATGLAKAVALRRGTPILAVPTTYAGSEMTSIWGLTEQGRKTTGRDSRVLPRVVVYDPELTRSMPAELTATSGMNALAHAVEAAYAPDVSPLVTLAAAEAVRALRTALPACVTNPDDLSARAEALYGAFLCGLALGNATMGVHHKICHVLGGAYNLPHGGVHSALLPYATAYNHPAAAASLRGVTAALDADDPATGLWDLAHRIGAPTDLVSVGFDPAAIDEVAAQVATASLVNPRPVTAEGVGGLLAAACAGARPGPAG